MKGTPPPYAYGYIIFNGLVLDGVNARTAWPNGFAICCGANAPTNVTFQNGEIKNFSGNGVEMFADSNKILNTKIHDNATNTTDGPPHGLYISGSNNLFQGNEVYNNGFYGFHVYKQGSNTVTNNIIRNNLIHHNGLAGYSATNSLQNAGVIISSGSNNQVYNNIIYSNGTGPNSVYGGGIQVSYGCNNCKVWNNTIYGNNGSGVYISADSSGVLMRNNIIRNNRHGDVDNQGIGTILSNNLTIDPKFLNESANDFRLQSGSAAIDAGADVSNLGINTDLIGVSRPQGLNFDIGAYEHAP
jgi:parallel beta-helix repeat protein